MKQVLLVWLLVFLDHILLVNRVLAEEHLVLDSLEGLEI